MLSTRLDLFVFMRGYIRIGFLYKRIIGSIFYSLFPSVFFPFFHPGAAALVP
eukprot:c29443_g1_i1 orf=109-264(-)